MKLKLFVFVAVFIIGATGVHAQDKAPVEMKENAIKDVVIAPATGSCANGLKPNGITNKSTTRTVTAKIETTVAFGNNHVSKKTIVIQNLSPQENRYFGCSGCVGQTCTTYKVLVAWYN